MNVKELLVRAPVEVAVGLGELESRTLERARLTLGYDPENSKDRLVQSNAAAKKIFSQVGIEQFTPGSVERYKKAMVAKVNASARIAGFFNNGAGIPITIVSGIGALATAILSTVIYFSETGTSSAHAFLYANWQWLFVPTILTAIISITCACMDETEYEWVKTPLKEYKAEVPFFALSRAIEICEQYPEAHVFVESLEARRRETVDPFLVVGIKGYLYYVDVWDEPKFEGRRVK